MPDIALRKRVYLDADAQKVIGSVGDIIVDVQGGTICIQDGVTAGGIPLASQSFVINYPTATGFTDGFLASSDWNLIHDNLPVPLASATVDGLFSAANFLKLAGIPNGGAGGLVTPQTSLDTPSTLVLRDSSGNFAAGTITANLTGNVIGTASNVTNGVVTTGSYSNPTWLTALSGAVITSGTIPGTVSYGGTIGWTSVTGRPTALSSFTNDVGFLQSSGSYSNPPWLTSIQGSVITGGTIPAGVTFAGPSGGVLSAGGRETSSPTAQTVIIRDAAGRAQVNTPSASNDIANLTWCKNQLLVVSHTAPPSPIVGTVWIQI